VKHQIKEAIQRFAYRWARTRGNPRRLEWYGSKTYSQSDEDGIVAEIFRRIGTTNKVFVEFGAEAGSENNTRLLLTRGWSGLWIEGNPSYAAGVQQVFRNEITTGRLRFVSDYVDRDNINLLIADAGFFGEIDFLSIDIDGNDYHVFEAINVVHPRVVCLEHNHSYAPPVDWVMPYDSSYRWNPASGVADYGASITAMTRLAHQKGYVLVGCGLYSPNGSYVRSDQLKGRFSAPHTPQRLFNPLRYEKVATFPQRLGARLGRLGRGRGEAERS
jgi:hypothetical protein